jgi:hypothetical protein
MVRKPILVCECSVYAILLFSSHWLLLLLLLRVQCSFSVAQSRLLEYQWTLQIKQRSGSRIQTVLLVGSTRPGPNRVVSKLFLQH